MLDRGGMWQPGPAQISFPIQATLRRRKSAKAAMPPPSISQVDGSGSVLTPPTTM